MWRHFLPWMNFSLPWMNCKLQARKLNRRIERWSRNTENHQETRRDDPEQCPSCLGQIPLCPSLCKECQGFSSRSHVLFCRRARLRNHELGSLSTISARKDCSLCHIISDSILEKLHLARPTVQLNEVQHTLTITGPFWPCGQLGTWIPSSGENSRFHEFRAFYRINASFHGNDGGHFRDRHTGTSHVPQAFSRIVLFVHMDTITN